MGFSSYVYGYIAEANQNPSDAGVPFEEEVLALQKNTTKWSLIACPPKMIGHPSAEECSG
jgi:hypothetical protein